MSLLKKLAEGKPVKDVKENIWDLDDAEMDAMIHGPVAEKPVVKEVPKPAIAVPGMETEPKATVLRLFRQEPDTDFVFKTPPNRGAAYLNNMRQVISRARKIAAKEHRSVIRWKVLVVDFKQEPTHDLVTVVRTQSASLKQQSVYDELLDAMNAQGDNDEE